MSKNSKTVKKEPKYKENTKDINELFCSKNVKEPEKPLFSEDNLLWVAKSFFDEMGILRHQIESYNNFVNVLIHKIIEENSTLVIEGEERQIILEFSNPFFDMPRYSENDGKTHLLYPQEAKDRDASYSSSLYVDITKYDRTIQKEKGTIENSGKKWTENKVSYKKQLLGKIPVMVASVLCNLSKYHFNFDEYISKNEDPYDQGGYFIVNGGMKIVISQERTSFNKVYTFEKNKKSSKYEVYSEVRSSASGGAHTTTTQCGITKTNKMFVNIPYIPPTVGIPIGILFKALGIIEEKDMLSIILDDTNYKDKILELLIPNLESSCMCKTQENALLFIGKLGKKYANSQEMKGIEESELNEESEGLIFGNKNDIPDNSEEIIEFASKILREDLFPHLGQNYLVKTYYFGYMIYKFLCVKLKINQQDDRDHYANKRGDTVGVLLHNVFYTAFKKYKNDCKIRCENLLKKGNALLNPISFLLPKIITKTLNTCLSTGNWCGYKSMNTKKNGVSQVYEIFNYTSRLSNARKFTIPIGENNTKIILPRRLHNSQHYIMCPFENPEGKNIGLVKNISLMTYITIGYDHKTIMDILISLGFIPLEKISDGTKKKMTKVFINSLWLGFVKEPREFYNKLKRMKLYNNINIETGIAYDDVLNEIKINTDSGRFSRPLLVVENQKLKIDSTTLSKLAKGDITFTELCSNGMVELVDPDEAEFILLAERVCDLQSLKKFTHCMVDPNMMLGIGACQTPFANHNQSPRIVYHCAQCKQAVGIPNLNFDFVMDGSYHILHYPQKPLVKTESSKLLKTEDLPTGINAIVAIMPYRGFNQEDSIIINKSFIERGGFHTSHITHYSAEIKKNKKQSLDIPDSETCVNFKGTVGDYNRDPCELLSRTRIDDDDNNKNYYVNVVERNIKTKIYCYGGTCRQNKAGISPINKSFTNLNKDGYLPSGYDSLTFENNVYNSCRQEFYNSASNDSETESKIPYGVIQVGSIVRNGDILIGITQEIETRKDGKNKLNCSIVFDADDYGYVKKIQWGRNANGYVYVKVKVVSVKIPILGDKFSSRYGQKGTAGLFEENINMPFSPFTGMTPDIIVNSIAFTSRMTIGQPIECLLAKKCSIMKETQNKRSLFKIEREKTKLIKNKEGYHTYKKGKLKDIIAIDNKNYKEDETNGDGSSFQQDITNKIIEWMKGTNSPKNGSNTYGNEVMYNGMTGEPMNAMIFMGPTYYQRLKHMVDYKIHARARGKMNALVHQPSVGRAQDGGLRLGKFLPKWRIFLCWSLYRGDTGKLRETLINKSKIKIY